MRQQSTPLSAAAKLLGYFLLALGVLCALGFAAQTLHGDRSGMLGTGVLALAFGLPGWLFHSWAAVAERRQQAAVIVRTRERFTIDEVAKLLQSSPEVAHVFIAGQIARHGLQLVYQADTKGYAKRALSAPAVPCPSCGVAVAPTEAGFCPSCGARR